MAYLEPSDYRILDEAGAPASMFYPRDDLWPATNGARDQLIEVASGISVGARFFGANPEWPTLLYFHGNGEIASDYDDISSIYEDRGMNLFVAEFRGYGASGGIPTVEALVGDAHPIASAFHAFLDVEGYTGARWIMGRSMGAQAALEAAAQAPTRFGGLIIESGAGNIRRSLERYGLLDTERGGLLAKAHDEKIASIALPTLIIHGQYDDLVPLARAHELFELMTVEPRQLVTIPEAGHNDLLWVGEQLYFDSIVAFIEAARVAGALE
ncbi:MAG: alpha/beta hydrolase [Dehalococcoidia bacterium]|nr:alpha/beta hydrolase [Dehalococcoidia bacterium]